LLLSLSPEPGQMKAAFVFRSELKLVFHSFSTPLIWLLY
jgi:hypothetical protein